ncbi:hypothetical protein CEUSTIGMA_g7323.t1 [Chlamydomonas eustigma]|uniref:Transmembrane protein 184C n=1 Tax=Chlamydomonas eustigma TaxID=1157962 RepID=A0A250X9U1_9CHLO|nr:hypothetical protein CEUSTIGMA_g7323.t1 [Chlamydomonas eustigma]|eukprot:GAX79883.1 hypothetical protein CEUSTIGMA_g7323.t1 [Chlamydomonas eustigma]
MFWPLRRVFRLFWWFLCTLTILALPLTIWEFSSQGYDIHYQAWFIGGIFVILSFPISVYEVAMHTEYYTRPRLQRHVIRILWMVPIYGVDAWLALRFRDAREYIDPIRECYEAYVIYNFYAYLMAYLEETVGDLEVHMSKKPPMQHIPVVRWMVPPWQMGAKFLLECKKGVMNFVIMRPLCTAIGLITDIFDLYGQGQIDFGRSYVYLAAATNFSQVWALYCLAMMYHKMHDELSPIRPLSKFIVVKAVVFVTFWQGILIAILVYKGIISRESWTTYDQLNVASGIQDFLICIEMFFAALAYAYAFPPRDYMDPLHPRKSFFSNVKHMFDLSDVMDDMTLVVEDHASVMVGTATATTSSVLRLPQRALSAAVKAPSSLFNLITGAAKHARLQAGSGTPSMDEDSRLALLSPEERDLEVSARAVLPGEMMGKPPNVRPVTNLGLVHGNNMPGSLMLDEMRQPRSRKGSGGPMEGSRWEAAAAAAVTHSSGSRGACGEGEYPGSGVVGVAVRPLRSGISNVEKSHELQQRSSPMKEDTLSGTLTPNAYGAWSWDKAQDGERGVPARANKAE